MKKIIGYVRVSTDEQAKSGLGLEDQIEKISNYCKTYDLDLIDIIIDEGASAKNLKREGVQRVIELAESDTVDGVVVAKLDRLTRSMRDLHTLLATTFTIAEFHCVTEKVDTSTASGKLCINLLMSVAEWEREVISERTSSALQAKKRKLNRDIINGSAPYGKQWADGEIVDNEEEMRVLDIMINLRNDGYTFENIAKHLCTEGIFNRRGTGWTMQAVRSALLRHSDKITIKQENVIVTRSVARAKAEQTIKTNERRTGKKGTGRAPFGYEWVNGKLVESATEQPILKTIIQLRKLGQTLHQIADALEAMGHKTRRGGRWKAGTVHAILKKVS